MGQKIVLEVVPWVDSTLKSGWSTQAKKELLKTIQQSDIALKVANKDLWFGTFLELFAKKFTYAEYQKLLAAEKVKAMETISEESLIKSGQLNSYLESLRKEAQQLRFSNKTPEAIITIQKEIIDKKRATAGIGARRSKPVTIAELYGLLKTLPLALVFFGAINSSNLNGLELRTILRLSSFTTALLSIDTWIYCRRLRYANTLDTEL